MAIDFHIHLLAVRHAPRYFAAARHYGFAAALTQTPLEEALTIQRDYGDRLQFVVVPRWQDTSPNPVDEWLRRLEAFYNMGARIVKFHMAPRSMAMRNWRLDSPKLQPIFREALGRKMAIMTHVGDPDLWYANQYADAAKYGTREEHYQMWQSVLAEYPGVPWLAAHMGGNPENLPRLQYLLDKFPNLVIDSSATKWVVRELSARREQAREFFVRNEDRIIFGTDLVTGDDRDFELYASRFWVQRKMWETGYIGPSPILDPDLPAEKQPVLRGLALPDATLQKLYHTNGVRFLGKLGICFEGCE
jgi:predicted TIM-barrel fold metal-dependent hydrolase